MRCLSCDCNLNDRESVRKSPTTGEYLDLCDDCLNLCEIEYEDTGENDDDEYEEFEE